MKKTLILSRNVWPFLLIGGLLTTAILLAQSSFITTESGLPLALSIDLVITIPFIYFLTIRKTSIPKTTIVPIMVLGLILGLNILPEENQAFLLNFKSWVLPLVEFTVLGYIIYKSLSKIMILSNMSM
ncbi:MAG: hypothetical protein MK212_06520 [Saprospiraceae bacterium]|nr:hypothetical protein [Saprospiraceae bacterium]